ncbi:MAG: hypothetical protein HY909_00985 [Deltaproteobacteria bacterium]|nr:hypothetical protein [Deltaproteobacteria bacterium]
MKPAPWLLLGLLGCTSVEPYGVELRFASAALAMRRAVVEVRVVDACGTLGSTGVEPGTALLQATLTQGSMATGLGNVRPGRIGLYALARDARCGVYAAGCQEHTVTEGQTGTLAVTLTELMGPACPTTSLCRSGACGLTDADVCPTGRLDCDRNPANGCEASPMSDAANCGECGVACRFTNARGACVLGQCMLTCDANRGDCDGDAANGCEADLLNAAATCGACGTECGEVENATNTCTNGRCVFACAPGYADCDGSAANGCEVNLSTATANCGRCGSACALANATSECMDAMCAVQGCNTGFANCDRMAPNGCEVDTRTDPSNCERCGNRCPAGQRCVASTCIP